MLQLGFKINVGLVRLKHSLYIKTGGIIVIPPFGFGPTPIHRLGIISQCVIELVCLMIRFVGGLAQISFDWR